ncbi:ribokinase [Calidifontibacillus erzurumensis]|nr:ribokinase [Calidifontibacillus erzurumensis]
MKKNNKIVVIGSINMDLVTRSDIFPKPGETVLGTSFLTIPGGKGANQAVACARLGASVTMIGCVGQDLFGQELIDHLRKQGINVDNVEPVTDEKTGIASITLAENDNSIIVVPGANYRMTPDKLEKLEDVIKECSTMLLQLEIPMATVEKAVELGKEHGLTVILNPAPFMKICEQALKKIDYITPNEHEVVQLLNGLDENKKNDIMKKCIITKGSKGVSYFDNGQECTIDGISVDVVDTTGAGDSFNGALAVALTEGKTLEEACRFANIVGALSVTKLGAQTGMPTKAEVEKFLNSNKK